MRETLANLTLIDILFGVVSRWDWWIGWALSGIYIFWTAAMAILIMPTHPEMLAERAPPHADRRKWFAGWGY